jgi:hypothetical protein
MLACDVNSFGGSLVRATRRIGLFGLACLLLLTVAPTSATAAAGPYTLDLGKRADYVAQTNLVQCVGASMQMMLNMIEPGVDRTAKTQLKLQKIARKWSPPRLDGGVRKGASVVGWAMGLSLEGAGPYKVVGADSLDEAMLVAARAMRKTGRPVGLLVWRGRHAWVMSGFHATGDPLVNGARVTAAIVEDPLHPYGGSETWGPSPSPGEALSLTELGRQFVRRRSGFSIWSTPDLGGKYVLVLPYELEFRIMRHEAI